MSKCHWQGDSRISQKEMVKTEITWRKRIEMLDFNKGQEKCSHSLEQLTDSLQDRTSNEMKHSFPFSVKNKLLQIMGTTHKLLYIFFLFCFLNVAQVEIQYPKNRFSFKMLKIF